jgi:hypothetical protein
MNFCIGGWVYLLQPKIKFGSKIDIFLQLIANEDIQAEVEWPSIILIGVIALRPVKLTRWLRYFIICRACGALSF